MSDASGKRPDLIDYMTSGQNTGWVVEWTPAAGFRWLPNSAVPMPGGVQLSPDGRSIYYTSWSGKDIRLYDRDRQQVVKSTPLAFYPDNLSLRMDGSLLVAGLDDIGKWKDCFKAKATFCDESSTVSVIDQKTLQVKTVFQLPGGLLSGASLAVEAGRELILGSPSGDRIVGVDRPFLDPRQE